MNAEAVKASYRRMLGEFETVKIRRYTGTSQAYTDYSCLAKPVAYQPQEIIGNIVQGDQKIFAFADDIATSGIAMPITNNDRAVIGNKETSIKAIDGNTIRLGGVTIAYILQVKG